MTSHVPGWQRWLGEEFPPLRRRRLLTIFCWVAGIGLAVRLPLLVGRFFSPDDWVFANGLDPSTMLLRDGRFGYAALYWFLRTIGADPIHSYPFLGMAAIAIGAATMALLAVYWRIDQWVLPSVAVGLLFLLHPFQAETWSFRYVPFFYQLALLLSLLGLMVARRRPGALLTSLALLSLATSIYQVSLNFAATALAMKLAIGAIRDSREEGKGRFASEAFALLLTPALYLLTNRGLVRALGVPASFRTEMMTAHDVPARLTALAQTAGWIAGFGNLLIPAFLLVVCSILGLLSVAAAFHGPNRASRLLQLSGALVLAYFASVGVALPLRDWWPTARLLSSFGLVWAGLAAATMIRGSGALRTASRTSTALLLVGFAGVSNRVIADQQRVNSRDLLTAARAVTRLETLPGHAKVRRVAVIGHPWSYEDISTSYRDLNISTLAVWWAAAGVFSEVEGRILDKPAPDDLERARLRCQSGPHWPDQGSVAVEGELAILCF